MLEQSRTDQTEGIDRFRSLVRVYPSQQSLNTIIDQKIKEVCRLFLKLSRGKLELAEHQFVNSFSQSKYLSKQCGISKFNLMVMFQRASKTTTQTIDFFQFFTLLTVL